MKSNFKILKKKAWTIFSEYVRRKENGVCYTCGKKKIWNEQHAGHFRHNKLDFDEMNVHCQCAYCNTFLHGNLGLYCFKLIKEYGQSAVDDLIYRSNQPIKYSRYELEVIIEKYKEKLLEF